MIRKRTKLHRFYEADVVDGIARSSLIRARADGLRKQMYTKRKPATTNGDVVEGERFGSGVEPKWGGE